MRTHLSHRLLLALAALLLTPTPTLAGTLVRQATGFSPAEIQAAVGSFRTDLGNPNNGNAIGPLDAGRREINWDGAPVAAPPASTPADFFNTVAPRGVVYSSPGSGFQTSGSNGDPLTVDRAVEEFGNINPTYADNFRTFSAEKLFTAVGSNIMDVLFFVPGTNVQATVSGFGAVFTDVDFANTTKLDYYDLDNQLLFSSFVQAVPDSNESLSFLGVSFTDGEQVARVRITAGNAPLSANNNDGGKTDVVAVDDFFYSEPQAVKVVPEPSASLGLLLLGAWPAVSWLRRRGRKATLA